MRPLPPPGYRPPTAKEAARLAIAREQGTTPTPEVLAVPDTLSDRPPPVRETKEPLSTAAVMYLVTGSVLGVVALGTGDTLDGLVSIQHLLLGLWVARRTPAGVAMAILYPMAWVAIWLLLVVGNGELARLHIVALYGWLIVKGIDEARLVAQARRLGAAVPRFDLLDLQLSLAFASTLVFLGVGVSALGEPGVVP